MLEPHDKNDLFIRSYVRDCPKFVECEEYETPTGEIYTVCCDQDGHEWTEEE